MKQNITHLNRSDRGPYPQLKIFPHPVKIRRTGEFSGFQFPQVGRDIIDNTGRQGLYHRYIQIVIQQDGDPDFEEFLFFLITAEIQGAVFQFVERRPQVGAIALAIGFLNAQYWI